MSVAVIILILLLLASIFGVVWNNGYKANKSDMWVGEIRMWVGGVLAIVNLIGIVMTILSCFRFQIGTDVRTGYIYSVDEAFGSGTVHIRMGKDAGKDTQAPFCVMGENLEKARNLAGSDKKVKVIIPETGLHFESNIFACTTQVIIEENE